MMEPVECLVQDWKKRHKRKQTRPRSICEANVGIESVEVKLKGNSNTQEHVYEELVSQELATDDINQIQDKKADTKSSDGEVQGPRQIKQKPLCSKLCIRKERRVQKSPIRKEPSLSSEEITDIINATNENSTSPCTTNRYRRHFLKQLRKAEARRCKEHAGKENDTGSSAETETVKESDTEEHAAVKDETELEEEDNVIDGKRIKMDKAKKRDGGYECKVCHKKFHTTGLFMAHYICHSSFEKEHAGLVTDTKDSTVTDSKDSSDQSKSKPETRPASASATESKAANSSEYIEDSTYFCHVCNQRFNNINSLQ